MSTTDVKLSTYEKIGYSLGDAAANFVWRSTFFLPIFYTDTFGLAAAQTAILILVIRLSDGVTDVLMGSIADRTNTRYGKFRPWVLWSAPVLGLFLALLFTTPDLSDGGKLVYAYVIYFGLTLAYTANNVPYGALMGVMTSSVQERSVLASFRFIGAFSGGLLVMALTPYLVGFFGQGDRAEGYKYTMMVFAVLLVVFLIVTYLSTKERIVPEPVDTGSLKNEIWDICKNLPIILIPISGISVLFIFLSLNYEEMNIPQLANHFKLGALGYCVAAFALTLFMRKWLINKPKDLCSPLQKDLADLLTNKPWLILLLVGIMFGLFTVVRPSAASYYFKYVLGREDLIGVYFAVTLVASLAAAVVTGYLSGKISKRNLMIIAFAGGSIFNGLIFWIQPEQVSFMFFLAIVGEFFAGMMPVLFFSMLGDTADYSEWKNNRRATGLIFSAGTFINKTGHGFAGAIVLMVLAYLGYDAANEASIANSIVGMKMLMSLIPAFIGVLAIIFVWTYPLDDARMQEIEAELNARREA